MTRLYQTTTLVVCIDDETHETSNPSVSDLNAALAKLANKTCEFVILDTARGFIQSTWVDDGVYVDLRLDLAPDFFEMYCLEDGNTDRPFAQVEVILPLFWNFMANAPMPAGVKWTSIKEEFLSRFADDTETDD